MDINIKKNHGIVSAIKTELNNQGYDTSKANGSIWTQVMKHVQAQNEQNKAEGKKEIYRGGSNLFGSGHSNFVVSEGIIQLSKNIWDNICRLFSKKEEVLLEQQVAGNTEESHFATVSIQQSDISSKIAGIKGTPKVNSAEPSAILKQNVERARTFLTNQLSNFSKEELQKLGISEAKRERILEYLKNITYDNTHDSAQGKGAGIVFSINCKDTDNLENMITLLMHEANHCDENYLDQYPEDSLSNDLRHRHTDGTPVTNHRVNTKEEEKACETLGLLTTAVLIDKGVLSGNKNYGRYGNPPHPVTSYLTNKNLLEEDVSNWVNSYTNYPNGINDAGITVEHLKNEKVNLPTDVVNQNALKLQKGDVIVVGNKSYTIGGDSGVVLSPLDSIPVFQMVPQGNVDNPLAGIITFDALPPCQEELDFYDSQNGNTHRVQQFSRSNENKTQYETFEVRRNGKTIYTGRKY